MKIIKENSNVKIYHVSPNPDIKALEPRVSTHGKAYVYGTTNKEFALLFGTDHGAGDMDGIYGVKNDKTFYYEAFKDALKFVYYGQKAYLYELDPTDFETNKTSFGGEVVSEKPVKIIKCTEINTYDEIQKAIKENKFDFHQYSLDKDYQEMIEKHISSRIVLFDYLSNKETGIYKLCKSRFPEIVDKLESMQELQK